MLIETQYKRIQRCSKILNKRYPEKIKNGIFKNKKSIKDFCMSVIDFYELKKGENILIDITNDNSKICACIRIYNNNEIAVACFVDNSDLKYSEEKNNDSIREYFKDNKTICNLTERKDYHKIEALEALDSIGYRLCIIREDKTCVIAYSNDKRYKTIDSDYNDYNENDIIFIIENRDEAFDLIYDSQKSLKIFPFYKNLICILASTQRKLNGQLHKKRRNSSKSIVTKPSPELGPRIF